MIIFLKELVATFLVVGLGCAVTAGLTLKGSLMRGGGSLQLAVGWSSAYLIPQILLGDLSVTANPLLSLGSFFRGTIGFLDFTRAMGGQFLGGLAGGFLVYALYHSYMADKADSKLSQLCFYPDRSHVPNGSNFLNEALGSFFLSLLFSSLNNVRSGEYLYIMLATFFTYLVVFLALGGLTGPVVNPARDLGPRLVYLALLHPRKDASGDDVLSADWTGFWVSLIGDVVGAVLGLLTFSFLLA